MTVIVGYVPNETGNLAITEAIREASARQCEIVVVNVVPKGGFAKPTAAHQRDLEALDRRITGAGIGLQIRHVVKDAHSPAQEILAAAEESHAQLIIVGLHRRSAVGKALLGSTAQRVMLTAPCPVLSVRHESD